MNDLAWGKKVSPEFRDKIFLICDRFQWSPQRASDLMACIAFESAETFSPTIVNAAGSGAVGLIQFMPSTAKGLETTTAQLAEMTAVRQLDFVEAYFRPYYRRVHGLSDMYMAILLPRYVGKPDGSILFNAGTVAYRQNSALDANSDGLITKAEASAKVSAKLTKGFRPEYFFSGE